MLFDHVGVTTTDLASGRALLEGSIGVRAWTAEFRDEINVVWVQFGRCDTGLTELIQAPGHRHRYATLASLGTP
jgi:hypothetical protein